MPATSFPDGCARVRTTAMRRPPGLWPDVPRSAGRASLRTAVWALRRALGGDALVASRSIVGLFPEALRVDVAEVAALAAAGEDRLAVA